MIGMDRVDHCLSLLGKDGFAVAFLAAVEAAEAGQVMVFSYPPDGAACLLSRNFAEGRLGARLAAEYLDHGFRSDPLRGRVLALPPFDAQVVLLADVAGDMPEAYRRQFFEAPGLGDKAAVLATGAKLRLIVNLYRQVGGQPWPEAELRVLGRLALLHFESRLASRLSGGIPEALLGLSDRERAVCLGVLAGRKAEGIAHDLGIAATSVITYRKRAYAKLGISARAELFAICRD